jgi:hypothetical protein
MTKEITHYFGTLRDMPVATRFYGVKTIRNHVLHYLCELVDVTEKGYVVALVIKEVSRSVTGRVRPSMLLVNDGVLHLRASKCYLYAAQVDLRATVQARPSAHWFESLDKPAIYKTMLEPQPLLRAG